MVYQKKKSEFEEPLFYTFSESRSQNKRSIGKEEEYNILIRINAM